MVFLDHVQNLHIHAEKTHKDFGAHCMKYVNFVHDPEKQYRSTVPAVRPLSIGLQVTESRRQIWYSTAVQLYRYSCTSSYYLCTGTCTTVDLVLYRATVCVKSKALFGPQILCLAYRRTFATPLLSSFPMPYDTTLRVAHLED